MVRVAAVGVLHSPTPTSFTAAILKGRVLRGCGEGGWGGVVRGWEGVE